MTTIEYVIRLLKKRVAKLFQSWLTPQPKVVRAHAMTIRETVRA